MRVNLSVGYALKSVAPGSKCWPLASHQRPYRWAEYSLRNDRFGVVDVLMPCGSLTRSLVPTVLLV